MKVDLVGDVGGFRLEVKVIDGSGWMLGLYKEDGRMGSVIDS